MPAFYNNISTNSYQVGNKKPVSVSNQQTGVIDDMIPRDSIGIPLDKQYEYNRIMSRYQPPANVRWYDDDIDESVKDAEVARILAKYM